MDKHSICQGYSERTPLLSNVRFALGGIPQYSKLCFEISHACCVAPDAVTVRALLIVVVAAVTSEAALVVAA
jgi:hypothetical protein